MSIDINYKSEFDWYTDTSGVTITKYKGKDSIIVVPQEIDGKPVTSIGAGAFKNCGMLRKILLPRGVTSIGAGAFSGCSKLRGIMIPDGLTSSWVEAFEGTDFWDVWYTGSKMDWEYGVIDSEGPMYGIDQIFEYATIHFNA